MFIKFAMRIGVVSALLLGAISAHASAVSATAELFGMTSTGVTLSNDFYTQNAQTNLSGDTFNSGTVTQELKLNASSGINSSSANSTYTDSGLNLPHTDAGVVNSGSASSMFQWSFDFTALAAGTATFDFEYNYVATIINLIDGETAGVSASVNASVDGNPASEQSDFHYFSNQIGDANGIAHLLLSLNVADGQTGTITFTAASQAFANPSAVPVPAAIWLFGSAIAGMMSLRRRKA